MYISCYNFFFTLFVSSAWISEKMLVSCFVLALVGAGLGCELIPPSMPTAKTPGDNFVELLIVDADKGYVPKKRYIGEEFLKLKF